MEHENATALQNAFSNKLERLEKHTKSVVRKFGVNKTRSVQFY